MRFRDCAWYSTGGTAQPVGRRSFVPRDRQLAGAVAVPAPGRPAGGSCPCQLCGLRTRNRLRGAIRAPMAPIAVLPIEACHTPYRVRSRHTACGSCRCAALVPVARCRPCSRGAPSVPSTWHLWRALGRGVPCTPDRAGSPFPSLHALLALPRLPTRLLIRGLGVVARAPFAVRVAHRHAESAPPSSVCVARRLPGCQVAHSGRSLQRPAALS